MKILAKLGLLVVLGLVFIANPLLGIILFLVFFMKG